MFPSTEAADRAFDLIVIGGGLAGLTTAALVARAGRSVVVIEKSSRLGGRAATQESGGIHFNLGPHALYRAGHAFRLFHELQVPFTGRIPAPGRALLLNRHATHTLPRGLGALIASHWLSGREKWRFFQILARLGRLDARPYDRVPLAEWIRQSAGEGPLAGLLRALFRVSTYANDPEQTSAGAALDQLKLALAGNVWYLDGGWQTLVDGLRQRAEAQGATFLTGARAESVRDDSEGVSVALSDRQRLQAQAAVLAVPPRVACGLLDPPADAPLARWTSSAAPVRAACLEVALRELPRPERRFALGLDTPTYYSVHSAAARLAPAGIAVVHVMKYLGGAPEEPAEVVERCLEALLDRLQPGWYERVVERRFLPGMAVTPALASFTDGGLAGRPGLAVAGRPAVFLAGDWVGDRGMLADASAASAEEAARLVLARLAQPIRKHSGSAAHARV